MDDIIRFLASDIGIITQILGFIAFIALMSCGGDSSRKR